MPPHVKAEAEARGSLANLDDGLPFETFQVSDEAASARLSVGAQPGLVSDRISATGLLLPGALAGPLPSGMTTPMVGGASGFKRNLEILQLEQNFNAKLGSSNEGAAYRELLGQELIHISPDPEAATGKGSVDIDSALPPTVSIVLLYFSGRWCPLCKTFDETMKDVYSALKATSNDYLVELVFVSCDVSQVAYKAHLQVFGSIFAVEWAPERLEKIAQDFNVDGVPSLVVLDASDGYVLNGSGREDVLEHFVQTSSALPSRQTSASGSPTRRPELKSLKSFHAADGQQLSLEQQESTAAVLLNHWLQLLEDKQDKFRRTELFGGSSIISVEP